MAAGYAPAFTVVCARIGFSVVLKFMLGSDDLVWLAPFMARADAAEKWVVGAKYVMSVVFLTLLACALAVLVHTAAHSNAKNDDLVDEVIATIAAVLLVAYAVYMAHEEGYLERCCGGGDALQKLDAEDAPTQSPLVANESGASSNAEYGTMEAPPDEDDDELGLLKLMVRDALLNMNACVDVALCRIAGEGSSDEAADRKKDPDDQRGEDEDAERKRKADSSVIIVAFLGSMDDFMVYFTLALSSQLAWYELAVGITIGSILLAFVVGTLLQSSERVAACVEYIPVPVILVGLAAFILISAWTGFDGL